MNLPTLAKNRRLTAVIPALTGGLDLSKAPWLIADDALSDCRNMWWRDGALRTRPGFFTAAECRYDHDAEGSLSFYTDREGYTAAVGLTPTADGAVLQVYGYTPDGLSRALLYELNTDADMTVCCVPAGSDLAPYTLLLYVGTEMIVALSPRTKVALDVTHRVYEPLLLTNGVPTADRTKTAVTGTLYEPKNRLTDRFRCEYTSDGVGIYYYLPLKTLTGVFRVQVVREDGTVEYFTVGESASVSAADDNDVSLFVNRITGMFYFRQNDSPVALPAEGTPNNVRVYGGQALTGPSPFAMTFGTWYGGDRSGSEGGPRLFLGGSAGFPDTVIWSAVNNPFYFPQSSCAVVGDPGGTLTAFGKQDGALVLLKKNEIYLAENVKDDGATFPLTPLNTAIGCDCPDTVALQDNRLVWACRDGSVYRLSSLTSAGSRGVVRIGDPVRPLIKNAATLCARVYDGRFVLLADDRLLVLTAPTDGAWYRFDWHDPALTPLGLCGEGETIRLAARESGGGVWWFALNGEQDVYTGDTLTARPVQGMIRTKSYDFGAPETFKQVLGVAVEVAETVIPAYVTERSVYTDRPHRPDGGGLVRATPNIPRCRRLALQLSGTDLTVGSVVLYLRGGMR